MIPSDRPAIYAFGVIALLALLYLAGASTEAITRLLAAVCTTRKETVTSASAPEGSAGAPEGELPPDERVRL